jgi:hypothetical protein
MAKKNNIRKNVEYILNLDEESRNNDKKLLLMYWTLIDKVSITSNFLHNFMQSATMPESITRARRLIQEEGLYLPTEEVTKNRRKRQEDMKDKIIIEREVI